jgi:hypothetical protein
MSRVNPGAPIVVRAQNNIYTALAGIALLATLGAVVAIFVKGQQLGFDPFKM